MPPSRVDAPSPTPVGPWSDARRGPRPPTPRGRHRQARPDAARRASRLVVGLACVVGLVGVARPELLTPGTTYPGVAAASPAPAARGAVGGPTSAAGGGGPGAGPATSTDPSDTPVPPEAPDGTGGPGGAGGTGTVPVTGAPPDGRADRAIAFALAQRGIPYVWGGDGPAEGGWDCSGLTKAAYGAAGVGLTRTAQAQFDAGPHVADPTTPAPGDLVFFGTPSRVHHVGLYLGNGLMVHAPHTGTVVQVGRYRWPGDDYVGASRPAAPGGSVLPGNASAVVVPPSSSPGGAGSDPAPEGPAVSEPDPVEPAAAPIPAGVAPAPTASRTAPTVQLNPGLVPSGSTTARTPNIPRATNTTPTPTPAPTPTPTPTPTPPTPAAAPVLPTPSLTPPAAGIPPTVPPTTTTTPIPTTPPPPSLR